MEKEVVSFKVSLPFTGRGKEEKRVFCLKNNNSFAQQQQQQQHGGVSLRSLREKIDSCLESDLEYRVQYEDEEGDRITLGGEDEFAQLILAVKALPIKLYVVLNEEPCFPHSRATMSLFDPSTTASFLLHPGIVCICCHQEVRGFRYKCVVCHNFDICRRCESKTNHPGHDMLRIPTPRSYPPNFFNRLHRLYDDLQLQSPTITQSSEKAPADDQDIEIEYEGEPSCYWQEQSADLDSNSFERISGAFCGKISPWEDKAQFEEEAKNDINFECGEEKEDSESLKQLEEDQLIDLNSVDSVETIREIQGEIDKLLAPLTEAEDKIVNKSNNNKEDNMSDSSSSLSSNPFSLCEVITTPIIERVVIEEQPKINDDLIKPRHSAEFQDLNIENVDNKKNNSMTVSSDFDEITVEEVVEEVIKDNTGENEDKQGKKTTTNDHWSNNNNNNNDIVDDFAIRRALHRAGLDSSSILSSRLPLSRSDNRFWSTTNTEDKCDAEKKTSKRDYSYLNSSSTSAGSNSKVAEARGQMLAMGFSDEDGWLTQLITLKRGNIDDVLEVLAPVERGK